MRTVDDYLDTARKNEQIKSDRELSRRLGVTPTTVNGWRKKRQWPDDCSMLALARLAGVDPKIALVELNVWRAEGPAAVWYSELLKTVAILLIIAASSTSTFHEQINMEGAKTVYYGKLYTTQ